jgi:hypothetical protein
MTGGSDPDRHGLVLGHVSFLHSVVLLGVSFVGKTVFPVVLLWSYPLGDHVSPEDEVLQGYILCMLTTESIPFHL